MIKKHWLIIIILIILVAGALYWYFTYQLSETATKSSVEETTETEEITETEKTEDKNIKSIPLEKPPFLKD